MAPQAHNDADTFGADDLDDTGVLENLKAAFPNIAENDSNEASARIASRMLKAESVDDLFDVLDGNSSDKLVGKSLTINGVTWQLYKSDRGDIPQAVVDAVDKATGEVLEFVTTGGMLVYFLRRVEMLGKFPFDAKITEKTTKRGNKALNFERV
jgi:hypothetical protein